MEVCNADNAEGDVHITYQNACLL